MHYLLDTDTASFAIRGVYGLSMQVLERRSGQLSIAWPTETELMIWAYIGKVPDARFKILSDFHKDIPAIPLSSTIQHQYARLKIELRKAGRPISEFDLLIASTALVHDLVLVSHNTRHFRFVPSLRVQDWALEREVQ
jgi:tRNA(fMet)-specific endonuclease VapC